MRKKDRRFHVVAILVKYGADPNKRMRNGATALHCSVAYCSEMMTGTWLRKRKPVDVNAEIEMLDVLLSAGADVV